MDLTHVSWSKLERFGRCAKQFAFIYFELIRRPPAIAMVRGQAPHRSSQRDYHSKLETGELLPLEQVEQIAVDYVDEAFRGEVLIDGEFEGIAPKEAKARVRSDARKMASWHHEHLAPRIVPTAVELRVRAQFKELPIPYEGVIDVVHSDVDVRDLKTKTKAPDGNTADVSGQLTGYWGLFSALKKRPPKTLGLDFIWVTPKKGKVDGCPQTTTRNAEDFAIHLRRMQAMILACEKEIFPPAPEDWWGCSKRWCGFTDICPYFAGRERPKT